jgi:hypothetical protein
MITYMFKFFIKTIHDNEKCKVENLPFKVIDKCYKIKNKVNYIDNLEYGCNTNNRVCKPTVNKNPSNF